MDKLDQIQEIVEQEFKKSFTNIEDYEGTDQAAYMYDRINEELKTIYIGVLDYNLNKLTRVQKEFITDLDYRTKNISVNTLIFNYPERSKQEIINELLDRLSLNKNINVQVKKWFG